MPGGIVMADAWFYNLMGLEVGPVTTAQLLAAIESGEVGDDDPVRAADTGARRRAGELWPRSPVAPAASGDVAIQESDESEWISNLPQFTMNGETYGAANLAGAANEKTPSSVSARPVGDDDWFFQSLGELFGPISLAALREMARSGVLAPSDSVRRGSTAAFVRPSF